MLEAVPRLALLSALVLAPHPLAFASQKSEVDLQKAVETLLSESKEKALACAIAADRERAALGEDVTVVVGVQNKGEALAKAKDLALDVQSIAFEIDWSDGKGKPFLYTETHERFDKPTDYKVNELKNGEKLFKTFTIPTLKAAKYKIRGVYKGGSPEIRSNTVSVTVGEGQEGKELAIGAETPKGKLTIRLFADDAPNTTLHFVRLVKQGFYNGSPILRIEPGFVIQTGDPKGDGSGGPGYTLKAETNAHKHVEGTVSMARITHPDSGGSQFFVCLGPAPHLDGGAPPGTPGSFACTAFGEVISGIDAVREIGKLPVVDWKIDARPTFHKPAEPITLGAVALEIVERPPDQKQ